MLTGREREYFNRIKGYISTLFRLNVPIFPLDHARHLQVEPGDQILGCCHKIRDNAGETIGYLITIDEPYIRACYFGRQLPYSPYSDMQLIETICHEIAHMTCWEHDEKHAELTKQLYDTVMQSLQFKRSL